MKWYDDPILVLGMALLGVCVVFAGVVGVCLILLWYRRRAQAFAYDRLPINWGEPLIQERTLSDDVVDLDVAELQNELLDLAWERNDWRRRAEAAEAGLEKAERARKRHWATVQRQRKQLAETRWSFDPDQLALPALVGFDTGPIHVPEVWTHHHRESGVREIPS